MRSFSSIPDGQQSGFTLIEGVTVVLILSILAGVAIPNFGDLSGDAKQSAANGIAGAAAAAAANRAAECKGKLAGCPTGVSNSACTTAYFSSIMSVGTATFAGSLASCVVTYEGKTATFKSY